MGSGPFAGRGHQFLGSVPVGRHLAKAAPTPPMGLCSGQGLWGKTEQAKSILCWEGAGWGVRGALAVRLQSPKNMTNPELSRWLKERGDQNCRSPAWPHSDSGN